MSDPWIVNSYKNIAIIKIAENKFCVQRVKKLLFGITQTRYFVMNRLGTDFMFDNLADEITIADYERAKYIFDCNCIKMGMLLRGKQ